VLAVVALLGLATLAAALSSVQVTRVPLPKPAGGDGGGAAPSIEPTRSQASGEVFRRGVGNTFPSWLAVLAEVLCVVTVAVVVLLLVWYLIRERIRTRTAVTVDEGAAPQPRARVEEVAAAVDAGLEELSDADRDPRRAVIACWVRLEQAAAAAGTRRQIGDTPTELVLRLLAEHRVSRQVLDGFATVYREARYSTGPVDERMRITAVTALQRLRAELAADVVPVGEAAARPAADASGGVTVTPVPRRVRPGGPEGIP
jgi:hypothetical protein